MSTLENQTYQALTEFIEANQTNIYRFAYSYVKNRDAALDVVQETIYKALKAHTALRNLDGLKAWVYKILINVCMDELRRSSKVLPMSPEILKEESTDTLECKADNMALHDALYRLPSETRTIIILHYFEDMKLKDIALSLNINLNTVKTKMYRGLDALKLQMEEEEIQSGQ